EAEGERRARAPTVRRVIGHQGVEELRHGHAVLGDRIPTPIARRLLDTPAEELDRVGIALALARLPPALAIGAPLDPPDPAAAVNRAQAGEMLAIWGRRWRDLREELLDHRGRRHRLLCGLVTRVHACLPYARGSR